MRQLQDASGQEMQQGGVLEQAAGAGGQAGLLWLTPIKLQGCNGVAATVVMLTWLSALMQRLQAGCQVASSTVIVATGTYPPACSCPGPHNGVHPLLVSSARSSPGG